MLMIKNLRGPIMRIGFVQMLESLRKTRIVDLREMTIRSSAIDTKVGYQLAGSIYQPTHYCDAMPSFPVFYEYWPCVWGTTEDVQEKTFVFNPNFIEEIHTMADEDFYSLIDEILMPVDRSQYDPATPVLEVLR